MDTTTWTLNDWIEAIKADTPGIDRAIKEHAARLALAVAEKESKNNHDPKGCRKSHCVHGNPAIVQAQVEHAARLVSEAQELPSA